ncbi:MAG: helix-turn-helix domain-containing protein [Terriglobia bacterium]
MPTLRQKFGQRILGIRRQKGMTQERFAEVLDISVDFLSLIERGINAPSFETLEKMGKRLRMEPRDLFDFSGSL